MFGRHPEMGIQIWAVPSQQSANRQWTSLHKIQPSDSIMPNSSPNLLFFFFLFHSESIKTCPWWSIFLLFFLSENKLTTVINKNKLPVKWKAEILHKYFRMKNKSCHCIRLPYIGYLKNNYCIWCRRQRNLCPFYIVCCTFSKCIHPLSLSIGVEGVLTCEAGEQTPWTACVS